MRFSFFRSFLLGFGFATSLVTLSGQSPSPHLHVDQFGYQPTASKVAVISDPQQGFNASTTYTPGGTLEIRDAQTDAAVWSGAAQPYQSGATDAQSGDRGWWLDFSDLTQAGEYYLLDPATNARTGNFQIGETAYATVLRDAGRMFFYNRCNFPKDAPYAEANWTDGQNFTNPLQDTECSFVNDRENAALRRDLSGGWFDAGDYNKYVTFAENAVHDLLWAYRENPAVFTDDWNLPESGNGIPDLLDELKWELDWIMKMTNPDGSTIIKMGSIDFGDNAQTPPSVNTDRRYYGPTCTSASVAAAGMLAHGAYVLGDIPAFAVAADQWADRAVACFDYWNTARANNALETNCDDGTIKAGDADRTVDQQLEKAVISAVHLLEETGLPLYRDYVDDHYTETTPFVNNDWNPYNIIVTSALLRYGDLPLASPAVADLVRTELATAAANNWNGYFGAVDNSLYRAFMPNWSYHWGSNSPAASYGNLNQLLIEYDLNPAQHPAYRAKAAGMVHYFHGVNPLGLVMLSGMEGRGAERGIQEIYHTWFNDGTDWDNSLTSPYGPAPGFVTGGPNQNFSVTSLSPPTGQPMMKAYRDWNTGWPENSWEITEPAIYYQAAYVRLLASQAAANPVLPVVYQNPLRATARPADVLLQWRTAAETNADYFEVQWLSLQDRWISLGRVEARGAGRYEFVHQDPVSGPNTYRLRQVDHDGRAEFSNLATVQFSDRYAAVTVFPNPLDGSTPLRFRGLPAELELRVFDASGRPVLRRRLAAGDRQVAVNGWPGGWYGLELTDAAGTTVWRGRVLKRK